MAREITTERYGPQPPKPPLWLRLGLKLVERKLAGVELAEGGTVDFSWLKSSKKGAQAVGEAAIAVGIVALIDYLLSAVDTSEELKALGLPALYTGVVLFGVRVLSNWWKVKRTTLADIRAEAAVAEAEIVASAKVQDAKAVAETKVDAAKVVAAEKVADAKETK